jgi:hypothetical protein
MTDFPQSVVWKDHLACWRCVHAGRYEIMLYIECADQLGLAGL